MKITFLGTGTSQGVPIIACRCKVCKSKNIKDQRLRSSILVEFDKRTIVVDTGPDFRQQMLNTKVSRMDAVLFTHSHRDHLSGLDDIRGFNYRMKRKVDLYCEDYVSKAIRKEFFYAFEEPKYPGVPEMDINIIDENPFTLFGQEIIPIRVFHHKMPVLGFRFNDFVYITDANRIPDSEKEKIRNCKVLVLNALRKGFHISHFTLKQAIDMSQELGAKTTYLTHISHQLGLHNEVEKDLPPNVHLSYDGLKINLR